MSAEPIDGRAVRRPRYRLRRNLREAAAMALGVVVLIWTLAPIYNIVLVALEPHGDVFTNDVWPAKPSFESFRIVLTAATPSSGRATSKASRMPSVASTCVDKAGPPPDTK